MADIRKPAYVNLAKSARRVITAHEAVILGIATHAQKEQDRRHQEQQKREAEYKLSTKMG